MFAIRINLGALRGGGPTCLQSLGAGCELHWDAGMLRGCRETAVSPVGTDRVPDRKAVCIVYCPGHKPQAAHLQLPPAPTGS